MQEQTPGYPHGDGDCAPPGCDCGKVPCGFYLWNHSTTAVVHGQTFQEWFINDYMLNKVGMSPLVSGFFWDDVWPDPGGRFRDSQPGVAADTGLDTDLVGWGQITASYHANMDALRTARRANCIRAGVLFHSSILPSFLVSCGFRMPFPVLHV